MQICWEKVNERIVDVVEGEKFTYSALRKIVDGNRVGTNGHVKHCETDSKVVHDSEESLTQGRSSVVYYNYKVSESRICQVRGVDFLPVFCAPARQ